jgi:hypothetical protein
LSNIDPRTQKFIDSIANNEEFTAALKALVPHVISETNDISFAYFATAMTEYMRQNIKEDFRAVRASTSATKVIAPKSDKAAKPTGNWRQDIDARFDGRGNVWVLVAKDMIAANLVSMRNAGIDCDDYERQIDAHGKAWMRYMGTRMHPDTNAPCALFWIWPAGSKGVVGKMDETPYKAGFEDDKPKNFGKKVEAIANSSDDADKPANEIEVTASDDDLDEIDALFN